jgi:Transposase.
MDIKTQVIQEYLAGGTSYRKLSTKYGISRDLINKWVMIYQGVHNLPLSKQQQQYALSSMNSSKGKKSSEEKLVTESLQQKIVALEKQLEWEKLRTEALNTMIDIAEKDLNISIRKKHGAQQ